MWCLFILITLSSPLVILKNNSMKEKGFSLAEILLLILAISFIVILLSNLPNAIGLIGKSRHLSLAQQIATKQIEDKRGINYTNLVNDTTVLTDTRLSSLPNSSGTVTLEDCPATICTNGENLKKITVTVFWTESSKDQQIKLETFIGEGGLDQ